MRWLTNSIIKVFGYQELRLAKELKNFESYSKDQINFYQLEKLNYLIEHFRKFPFYSNVLKQHDAPDEKLTSLEQLKRFPIVTKDIISENLDYISSRPEAKLLNSTSGSTGKNFQFYQSKEMLQWRRAANIIHFGWIGVDHWSDRKLTVWGLSPKTKRLTHIMQEIKVALKRGRRFQGYGLDDEKCKAILEEMHKYKPACLSAYPGYAYEIARAGQKYNIEPPALKAIVVSGETVFEHQRKEIEKYFGCKTFNRYGSREFGSIAHECEQRTGLHIHPARLYVETDENGELLVTDLNNFATPFIRYAIGDAGQITDANCPCGRNYQSIVELQGRCHDIIKTKSGKLLPGQFWTTLSRSVPGVEEFQLVQKNPELIEMRIIVNSKYKDENESKFHHKLHTIVGDEIKLDIVKVNRLELTPAGKRKFVIKEK